jgi:hypothetical protein
MFLLKNVNILTTVWQHQITKYIYILFQPEYYEYTVVEGEFVNIAFTSTVPIGCISSHSDFIQRFPTLTL